MNLSLKYLFLWMFLLVMVAAAEAQPSTDRRDFYRTKIQHNLDPNAQRKYIGELRRQLPDTADPVDTRQRQPAQLSRQREALFLNFLCYMHEASIDRSGTCGLQQGYSNYERMVALGPLEGYPKPEEEQNALELARYLERELCLKAFRENGDRIDSLPHSACGCASVLEGMFQEGQEALRAHAAWETSEEAQRAAYRDAARRDSLERVDRALNDRLSRAIYAPNGSLRCDTTMRIRTTDIDGLNDALLEAMFRAAQTVFRSGPESERDRELLASLVQEDQPGIWPVKARKNGGLFILEYLTIGEFGSNVRLRLIAELSLQRLGPFVGEGEVVVLPYRVMLDPSLTGTNVRLEARDGYVNILLRPIPEVRKD